MTTTTPFDERLQALLRILSIPSRHGWPEARREDHIYAYWHGLGLIDGTRLQTLTAGHGELEPTAVVRRFFRDADYYWRPGIYRDRVAADLGSGYGHLTLWLLLSGARAVLTVGDRERVQFVRRLYEEAVREGLLPAGSLVCREGLLDRNDRTLSRQVPPDGLALVLMNDTLEHINPRIRGSVLKACFDDLAVGGLLVSKQHNSDCPRTVRRLRRIWDEFEASRHLQQRREMIRAGLPGIPELALERLAQGTRGLDRCEVENAILLFKRQGTLPAVPPAQPPINIETDEVCEGLTSIPSILGELRAAGFRARVYPAMRESRRSRYVQELARMVPAPFLAFHVFDDTTVFVGRKDRQPSET